MLPLAARYADVAKEVFTQETESGIRYQDRNGTTQKAFSKALTSAEWKKYNNAMVTKIDEDLFQVQVVAWYDNENSYTCQMVRTAAYLIDMMK